VAQLMVRNLTDDLLLHDLTVLIRSAAHYEPPAVRLFNPFT
jgi:hypothetical protein